MNTNENTPARDTNDDLATIRIAGTPHKGFTIPAPPDDPTYHERSAGLVGDYRPLAERQADEGS